MDIQDFEISDVVDVSELLSTGKSDHIYMCDQNKSCRLCGHNQTIKFHEHYYFCPECSAIYTFNILQSAGCDHIKDGVLTVLREPWYKSARSKIIYAKEIGKAGYTVCSKCGKECVVDGW